MEEELRTLVNKLKGRILDLEDQIIPIQKSLYEKREILKSIELRLKYEANTTETDLEILKHLVNN